MLSQSSGQKLLAMPAIVPVPAAKSIASAVSSFVYFQPGIIVFLVVALVIVVVIGLSLSQRSKIMMPVGGALPGQAISAQPQVNTHTYGWTVLSFLVSFLWFRVNGNPVFPVGFVVGVAIAFWSHDIDRALGRQSLLTMSVVLAVVGMLLGLIIR